MTEPAPRSATTALDTDALAAWMQRQGLLEPGIALQAQRLPAGQSNPTWLVQAAGATAPPADRRWVLRAKPGPVATLLPSAHAIEREHAVMRALAGQGVPVPAVQTLCDDESVLGVAFYLMDFVDGRIFRDATLPGLTPAERGALHGEILRVLAALHQVDWRAAGLGGFGRPDGYFERLVARWTRQYRATQTQAIPAMEQLIAWLPGQLPRLQALGAAGTPASCALVHGDYRLENLVFHPTEPRVLAVLDWELSTVGHPLADLAYHGMAWHITPGALRGFAGTDLAAAGIPTEQAMVQRYCTLAGRDDADAVWAAWPLLLAINGFRLAAILQGIAKRVAEGIASHPQALETARLAAPLAARSWDLAQGAAPSRAA